MPILTIDNREIDVPQGTTLLEAARRLGIEIPTLCYMPGLPAATSCMVCLVKNAQTGKLLPSCATKAEEGMVIESDVEDVRAARRSALELLLSDHLGDCEAPCHRICPAHMDIPRMIREIAAGDLAAAIRTVKADIALPAMLGRICPELCERGCRRKDQDQAVSICLLKRYVADVDLAAPQSYRPAKADPSGKRVAIVGAGPAGLSAAYYLLQAGHDVVLLEAKDVAGGAVREHVDPQRMEPAVLDAEIGLIEALGAEIRTGQTLGGNVSMDQLTDEYDAVLLAMGEMDTAGLEQIGLPAAQRGLETDTRTLATPIEGVFAAGAVIRPINKQAVRAVADGKHAARAISAKLAGEELPVISKPLSTSVGKLQEGEIDQYMQLASDRPRQTPADIHGPLSDVQAVTEATRCLHCDCRKQESCRLRLFSQEYDASTNRYHTDRRDFAQDLAHPDVIYEPGKCILCGLCVRIAESEGEEIGLTFVGRGFSARVDVPMDRSMSQAVTRCALRCVEACPTGALALRQASPAPAEQAD